MLTKECKIVYKEKSTISLKINTNTLQRKDTKDVGTT